LYFSHAKQIRGLDELEQQANVTLPTGNCGTLPQRDTKQGNSKKITKARLSLMP